MIHDNPLLSGFLNSDEATPFHKIKAEHFEPAFEVLTSSLRDSFQKIIQNKDKPTFRNTIVAYEQNFQPLSRLSLLLFNLNSAETSDELQQITQRISVKLTELESEMNLNSDFFRRIETIYKSQSQECLTNEEHYLLKQMYNGMKRDGAPLEDADKKRLIDLLMNISEKTLQFDENVLHETNAYQLHLTNENDLSGLPQSFIETMSVEAKARNIDGWIVTLDYPSYSSFMKYSDRREIRKTLAKAYGSRANLGNEFDNKELILEIVNLRVEVAQLLGYKNYLEYVLEEQMAETPERVHHFLDEIHKASKSKSEEEIRSLQQFSNSIGCEHKLESWDFAYYSEKQKKKLFGFEEEELKPFFQLEKVILGVFELASRLYGLTFKEVFDVPVYHLDVKTYQVFDNDGTYLSLFYADFHPRHSKQDGAWMTEYLNQSCINDDEIRPHISICCNFTKPTESKPSLLTFSEVETLLHEFGHALHGMLANTTYPSLSGTNVYRDFVELPSQLLENWATEKSWLDTFAVHFETGVTMSDALVQQLINARNYQAAFASERQLSFGMTDMSWHEIDKYYFGNVIDFEQKILKETQRFSAIEGTSLSTAFSHIFSGGYAAGYYGYKWAEVLDADVFEEFKSEGIFDTTVALKFRKEILEMGGTDHPMKLYLKFKGKEPSINALLERSGLK